jgi:hypothetical protein
MNSLIPMSTIGVIVIPYLYVNKNDSEEKEYIERTALFTKKCLNM